MYQLLESLVHSLVNEPCSWVASTAIGLLTLYTVRFYCEVTRYPRGPFPVPVFGNFLAVMRNKKNLFEMFADLSDVYGPVFTVWMGPRPTVVITDLAIAKEAFLVKKNEIAGRPPIKLFDVLFESGTDILLADFGPDWEHLRRVAHAAVRRYSVSDKLAVLVADVTDETVEMMKKEGVGKAFNPYDYLSFMVFNIIASSAFGKRYTIVDPELINLRRMNEEHRNQVVYFTEFWPILRPFFRRLIKKFKQNLTDFLWLIQDKYSTHLNDYQPGVVRDFTDAVIASKEEALAQGKESAPHLTDQNLIRVLLDLFLAGSDTTLNTLKWMLLLMANYPDMQRRMRAEIAEVIGDRIPVHEDRARCHLVNAFISESLRFRPVAPMSVVRKTMTDVRISGYSIPANTSVNLHTWALMMNPSLFPSPDQFKSERFLDPTTGHHLANKPAGFTPFGLGRRECLGQKLATVDLFLMLVRLLQRTNGLEFGLPEGPGSGRLEPDPNKADCLPFDYQVVFNKIY